MTDPFWSDDLVQVFHGDCLDVLTELADASIDSVVTDPPAGISFMGKDWDHHKGGRTQWVTWMTTIMAEVHRVLKPGGHILVWGLPRTSHWTAWAIEDAGFEVRDCITHLYGSGFPKSLNVALAIDKQAGATGHRGQGINVAGVSDSATYGTAVSDAAGNLKPAYTEPVTDDAKQWAGWGTALKPASEHWWLARKPLDAKTVAANVLAHGTGALNIDATRIDWGADGDKSAERKSKGYSDQARKALGKTVAAESETGFTGEVVGTDAAKGRWPANVVLSHTEGCRQVGTTTERVGGGEAGSSGFAAGYKGGDGFVGRDVTAAVWVCVDGCPVQELDRQSGHLVSGDLKAGHRQRQGAHTNEGGYVGGGIIQRDYGGDSGGASRFFHVAGADPVPVDELGARFRYVPKAGSNERPRVASEGAGDHRAGGNLAGGIRVCNVCQSRTKPPGADPEPWPACGHDDWEWGVPKETGGHIAHPTVKPLALMRWLVRLVTPPGGLVLDPFAGSGTTAEACIVEGFRCITIEREADYLPLIVQRLTKPIQQDLFS